MGLDNSNDRRLGSIHVYMVMECELMMEYNTEVVVDDWKRRIEFEYYSGTHYSNFHSMIWEMSLTAFDKPREVQVVIDKNDKLFISVGNPGFVSFDGQEESLEGMQMPLKEWIHTHPFGSAYFSGTDLRTIAIWERYLDSATVLGDNERMSIHFRVGPDGEHHQEFAQFVLVGDEEE